MIKELRENKLDKMRELAQSDLEAADAAHSFSYITNRQTPMPPEEMRRSKSYVYTAPKGDSMNFSCVSIRFYITGEDTSVDSLNNQIGIQFEKSRFNVCIYRLDIQPTNEFDDIYIAIRKLLDGKEDKIKSITYKKDIFIMVYDEKESGNFDLNLNPDSLNYLSNLGFALCFDIYG